MRIKVTKPFKYAHHGVDVVHYDVGMHDVCKRCADIAIAEGWAKKPIFRKAKVKK